MSAARIYLDAIVLLPEAINPHASFVVSIGPDQRILLPLQANFVQERRTFA